ncbi:uncharacterized protein [Watersipora subatra]|uniref:uncharacterized protein n=1 Tax=Watersipora subatra TaxID=2589382 RepID=UPI00355BA41F
MEMLGDMYNLEPIIKPRSLEILDQAYDPSAFKFSQIIRYLQDQFSFHQDIDMDPYDYSTSPLPVDPKLAYDIHTGRYMRRFKTQGSTIVGANPHTVVKLPYPPLVTSKMHHLDTPESFMPPSTQPSHKPPRNHNTRSSDPVQKVSHSLLRKQVWRLPSHVSAFNPGKYKQPVKLPPIAVSKLTNGI